jgi:hypothetical protein
MIRTAMDIVLMLLVIVTFQAIRVFVRTRGKGFLRFGMIGLTLVTWIVWVVLFQKIVVAAGA